MRPFEIRNVSEVWRASPNYHRLQEFEQGSLFLNSDTSLFRCELNLTAADHSAAQQAKGETCVPSYRTEMVSPINFSGCTGSDLISRACFVGVCAPSLFRRCFLFRCAPSLFPRSCFWVDARRDYPTDLISRAVGRRGYLPGIVFRVDARRGYFTDLVSVRTGVGLISPS